MRLSVFVVVFTTRFIAVKTTYFSTCKTNRARAVCVTYLYQDKTVNYVPKILFYLVYFFDANSESEVRFLRSTIVFEL